MSNPVIKNLGYVLGIVMVIFPIPLLIGKVPRNHLYGIRIPKAYKSDDNWYTINKYGAKVLIIWGIINIITEFLCINIFHANHLIIFIIPVLFLLLAIIQIFMFSRKIK